MSDFSNVTTPADLVALNETVQESKGIHVVVGRDPVKGIEVAKGIIDQLYSWHVNEAKSAAKSGDLEKSEAWSQDAGVLYAVFKTLHDFEI